MTDAQKNRYRMGIVKIIDGFFLIDSVMKELLDPKLKEHLLKLGNAIDALIDYDGELYVEILDSMATPKENA